MMLQIYLYGVLLVFKAIRNKEDTKMKYVEDIRKFINWMWFTNEIMEYDSTKYTTITIDIIQQLDVTQRKDVTCVWLSNWTLLTHGITAIKNSRIFLHHKLWSLIL